MQRKSDKTLQLSRELGKVIKNIRNTKELSCTRFAYQFDIDKGNLNRIENGLIDCKFTTLWRIAEAFDMKLSEIIAILEKDLPSNFSVEDDI